MRFMKSIAIPPVLPVSSSRGIAEPKIPQAKQNLSEAFKKNASPLKPQTLIAVLDLPGKSPVSWDTLKKK